MNLCRTCVVRMGTEAGLTYQENCWIPVLMLLRMLSLEIYSNVSPVENLSAQDSCTRMWRHWLIMPRCFSAWMSFRGPTTNLTDISGDFRLFPSSPDTQVGSGSETGREIVSTELPGIMNWVLEGRKRLTLNRALLSLPYARNNWRNIGMVVEYGRK